MAVTGGSTRQTLSEISALIDNGRVQAANEHLGALIEGLSGEALLIVSPDIRRLIGRFLPKRRKQLTIALDVALAKGPNQVRVVSPVGVNRPRPRFEPTRIQRYAARLDELRDYHIFQWATFYRERVGYIFKELFNDFGKADSYQTELEQVSGAFTQHAQDIYHRGYQYVASGGATTEVADLKSISGLQRFLYLIINIYLDSRDAVKSPRDARLIWDITSCLLSGVLRGYGKVLFGDVKGWVMLHRQSRSWIPAMGFLTGSDATLVLQEACIEAPFGGLFDTVLPTLIAFDQLANKHRGTNFLLPRLSRISISEPARLDITLSTAQRSSSGDAIVSCFYEKSLSDGWAISEAISLRATVVVARLGNGAKEWVDLRGMGRVFDASEVASNQENAHNFAEIVRSAIEAHALADAKDVGSTGLTRNYAREFPLEDPDTRRMYMVERHSVKQLLEQFEQGTGIQLWCSVRRSGKTTAASNLADMTGRSTIVVQTMDHQPHQQELNIFERRVREALGERKAIPAGFFEEVVRESALATTSIQSGERKFVFVIDEYESLFGLLAAVTNTDPDLRFLVALPLLSQMVGFSTRNLLILMGQRPDAHYILSSQNQLSPLAHQHNFPLFVHHTGSTDSEFVQFLKRVLTKDLPFVATFADAVHEETSGHPYLTVNLMVDLCDWLIENNAVQSDSILDANRFAAFARDRLSSAALQRSPHYPFFQALLGEYLSERGRRQEPWLHAVASVLQKIAKKHPRAFSCSIVSFGEMADPMGPSIRMTSNQFLASASMSNFLKTHAGQVTPAIRLLSRLAACAVVEVN